MDYRYETLGPERFQQVAQALLVREMPDVQCFPVAQPDGGRDATSRLPDGGFLVFQAKYVRRPEQIESVGEWVEDILQGELPKARRLIAAGATGYYLITNVAGTAHPGGGAIDRANAFIEREFGIPGLVWWRDELNTRLDNAFDLKWTYPELLSGADALRAVLQLVVPNSTRETAIRAFLTGQYEADKDIRFRQVDLQRRLLSFFVDVPAAAPVRENRRHHFRSLHALIRHVQIATSRGEGRTIEYEELSSHSRARRPIAGGADLLLDEDFQRVLPQTVLEGAPGQGKSTLAQYVCQVHRVRLLDKQRDVEELPVVHQSSPVRIPFRVDLRDLASWLDGQDPFRPDQPAEGELSLESFMARLVASFSGGLRFNVADVHATIAGSPVLIMFDGLDEVADISLRGRLVQEIEVGLSRLASSATNLQVVVTSRPAAFSNSPGFSTENFAYLELVDMTKRLMLLYADQWLEARRLPEPEGHEVRRVLESKLKEAHIRDLARNPMQLAILLSLIHAQGVALPDKRTALYDAYIDRFFSREAEKSEIVRDNRDILIQLHQFLAWQLHAEAETRRSSGRVTQARLTDLIRDYLHSRGHDEEGVSDLFHGMVERVVAIVSRVEGTFEFEVQPLREYFAGRYLYETAPYSPPGGERSGTKPERFAALARNFYWLNVARFYAGCYSRGELASLVDGLDALSSDSEFSQLAHPRFLATTLQTDWVFAQEPQSVARVVDLIVAESGFKILVAQEPTIPPELPEDCGRAQFASAVFDKLESNPDHSDYRRTLCDFLRRNMGQETLDRWREKLRQTDGAERARWIHLGNLMAATKYLKIEDIRAFLQDMGRFSSTWLLWELMDAGWHELAESEEYASILVDGLLDEQGIPRALGESHGYIEATTAVFSPWTYVFVYEEYTRRVPLTTAWQQMSVAGVDPEMAAAWPTPRNSIEAKCQDVVNTLISQAQRSVEEWSSSLDPWTQVVEAARRNWGERPAVLLLSLLSSGVADSSIDRSASDPFDEGVPLTHRVRYARLRAGNPKWWARNLEAAADSQHRDWLLALLLAWGSDKTLRYLKTMLDSAVEEMDDWRYESLYEMTRSTMWCVSGWRSKRRLNMSVDGWEDSPFRLAVLLGLRLTDKQIAQWHSSVGSRYSGTEAILAKWHLESLASRATQDPKGWKDLLKAIRRLYQEAPGTDFDVFPSDEPHSPQPPIPMPTEAAREILSNPDAYPLNLVAGAESQRRRDIAIAPVGDIASADGWFQ